MLLVSATSGAVRAQRDEAETTNVPQVRSATLPNRVMSPADESNQVAADYARCLVAKRHVVVDRVLSVPTYSAGYRKAMSSLATGDCLDDLSLRMPGPLLRGALYQALYKADFGRSAISLSPAPIDFAPDLDGNSGPAAQSYLSLHRFADCVVRADPSTAGALMFAAIASPAERAAFANLGPHLNACMVQGQTLGFTKIILSGLIAEVLYRERKAAAVH